MRKIYKEKTRGIIGILLIVVAIGGIVLWEYGGRAEFTYKDVLVLNKDVPVGTTINMNQLGTMRIDQSALLPGRVENPNDIVGKQTVTFIPKGLQLSPKFFADKDLVLQDGYYVFSIPEDWIYSCPQTLRRGDDIYFYPYLPISGQEKTSELRGESIAPETALLKEKVIYVKDNANREVIDVTPERMDGSAVLAKVEILIDDKGYQALKTYADQGYKFILMYQ